VNGAGFEPAQAPTGGFDGFDKLSRLSHHATGHRNRFSITGNPFKLRRNSGQEIRRNLPCCIALLKQINQ
jgi:hypothetical protein